MNLFSKKNFVSCFRSSVLCFKRHSKIIFLSFKHFLKKINRTSLPLLLQQLIHVNLNFAKRRHLYSTCSTFHIPISKQKQTLDIISMLIQHPQTRNCCYCWPGHCISHLQHPLVQTPRQPPFQNLHMTGQPYKFKTIYIDINLHHIIFKKKKHTYAHGNHTKTTVFATAFHLMKQSCHTTCT